MVMPNFDTGGLSSYQRELYDAAPRDVFFAGLPQNLSFNQRRFFENQYQPIFSDFLGQNVRRTASGQDAMPFLDYMAGLDVNKMQKDAPMSQTGMGERGITSTGRFFYGR
jgi:hypothetical protein